MSAARAKQFQPERESAVGVESTNENRLLDHFVRAREENGRNRQPQRLCRFEIDHQFELGRLPDWQLRRFRPSQDRASIDADLPIHLGEAGTIADEAAGPDRLAAFVNRGKRVARRQGDQLRAADSKEDRPRLSARRVAAALGS